MSTTILLIAFVLSLSAMLYSWLTKTVVEYKCAELSVRMNEVNETIDGLKSEIDVLMRAVDLDLDGAYEKGASIDTVERGQ